MKVLGHTLKKVDTESYALVVSGVTVLVVHVFAAKWHTSFPETGPSYGYHDKAKAVAKAEQLLTAFIAKLNRVKL